MISGRDNFQRAIQFSSPKYLPLRIGYDPTHEPSVKFRGYRMIDGIPEFHYELGGSDVRERITMAPDGKGLVRTLRIGGGRTAPVRFYTEPDAGVLYQSSAGRWDGHVLQLTTQEAREFTLTMTELPRKEPLGYWSMDNHIVFKETPVPGVVKRALDFQRKNYRSSVLETRIDTNQLQGGATMTAWIRPTFLDRTDQTIFGARNGSENQLWFGYHGDGRGLTLVKKTQGIGGELSAGNRLDDRWHFVAAVVAPDSLAIFLDGKEVARCAAKPITLASARLHIGSIAHKAQYYGLLDELRVFDRILDADEIAAIHRRERDQLENRSR